MPLRSVVRLPPPPPNPLAVAPRWSQHFKSHRDTPRDELAFGTLVVALPSKFRGGCLTVRHRGRENKCDWGKRLTKDDDEMDRHVFQVMTTPAEPVLQW